MKQNAGRSLLCAGLAAFCAIICSATDANAADECAPTLAFEGTLQADDYDPFVASPLIKDGDLNFSSIACLDATTIAASIGWGGQEPRLIYEGQELAFNLLLAGRDFTGVNSEVALTGPSSGVTVSLPNAPNGSLANFYRLVIPSGQIVQPGQYILDVPADPLSNSGLLSQTLGQSEVRASPIRIAVQVLSVMNLGVTGCDLSSQSAAGSNFSNFTDAGSNLDFASACRLTLGRGSNGMSYGDTARARLTSLSNINVRVAMTSRNGGALVLSGLEGQASDAEKVSYVASLQSQGETAIFECSGSDCGTSQIVPPSTSPLGTDLYFQISVNDPEIGQKRAGSYSDVITLTVQPAS